MTAAKPLLALASLLVMTGCIPTEAFSRDQAYTACRNDGVTDMNECVRDRMSQFDEERLAAAQERQRREADCDQRRAEAGARGVPHEDVLCEGDVFND